MAWRVKLHAFAASYAVACCSVTIFLALIIACDTLAPIFAPENKRGSMKHAPHLLNY